MPGAPPATVAVDGRVATITLNDPPANALSLPLVDGLAAALDEVQRSDAVVLVVRSAVPRFFMAGADLKHLQRAGADGFEDYIVRLRGVLERIPELPLISIAAIDGHALGGGFELAAACTLRVAGPGARLGVPEVKLGLLPGAGGTQRLPRLVGRGAALDLLLTGRSVGAEEALRIGMVDRVAEDGAEAEALRLAAEVAVHPRSALTAIVRCVDAARDMPFADGFAVERREIVDLFAGADAQEGLTAFVEKRPPRFS